MNDCLAKVSLRVPATAAANLVIANSSASSSRKRSDEGVVDAGSCARRRADRHAGHGRQARPCGRPRGKAPGRQYASSRLAMAEGAGGKRPPASKAMNSVKLEGRTGS